MRIGGESSEWFKVKTAVRQGCILSPCSFNIILDYVFHLVMEKVKLGKESSLKIRNCGTCLEYANDAVLLAMDCYRTCKTPQKDQ